MPSDDLDAFLRVFRDQGACDSEGVFTLDPSAAREKLARYQFANPYQYALLLISAAVLGGARSVEVTVDKVICSFTDDGRALPLPELGARLRLEHGLPASPRIRALALALVGAEALAPKTLLVESGGHRLVCEQDWKVEEAERVDSTRVILARDTPRRFFGLWKSESPEIRILQSHCALAGPKILVNGRSIQTKLQLGSPLATALVGFPERLPPVGAEPGIRFESSGDYSAFLGLYRRKKTLQLVVDGVLVGGFEIQLGTWGSRTGVGGVVACDGLTRDLSGLSVAENRDFQRLRECLVTDARWLACQLYSRGHSVREFQLAGALLGSSAEQLVSTEPRRLIRHLATCLSVAERVENQALSVYLRRRVETVAGTLPNFKSCLSVERLSPVEELTRLYLLLEGARRISRRAAGVRYLFRLLETVALGLDLPELLLSLLPYFQRSPAFSRGGQAYLSWLRLRLGATEAGRLRARRRLRRLGVNPEPPEIGGGPWPGDEEQGPAGGPSGEVERLLKRARRSIRAAIKRVCE